MSEDKPARFTTPNHGDFVFIVPFWMRKMMEADVAACSPEEIADLQRDGLYPEWIED